MHKNSYMHIPISYVDPHNHLPDPIGTSIPLSAEICVSIQLMYMYLEKTI